MESRDKEARAGVIVQCPSCGADAEFPEIDIGVGWIQCGPASCEACGWIEERSDECPIE